MRIQLLSLIILFSLLASFPVIASDWVYIDTTKDFKTYVDKQSIKGEATSIKFWERMVFKKEQLEKESGKYFIKIVMYVEIDCSNNISKLYEVTFYAIDGEVISYTVFSTPHVSRIAPDTTDEDVKEYVCSSKPKQ